MLLQVSKTQYFDNYCYHAQQTAEKAIKALLVYFGVEPEFTHDISRLLKELEKHIDIDDEIRIASRLTTYAIETRYPDDYYEINEDEYEEAVQIAKVCLDWVDYKIKFLEIKKNLDTKLQFK